MNDKDIDKLNATLVEVQKQFAERFYVKASIGFTAPSIGTARLGFGKIAGHWVLFYEREAGGQSPLLSTSIETRILAVPHLAQLFKALEEEQARITAEARSANEEAQDFLASLKGNNGT